jgi:asparagine synthase (glutamine-hydrolysing)
VRRFGFTGFSPFTCPSVIEVAEAIPFKALTEGSHERLYALKGEVVCSGMAQVTGLDMPVFEKRRFQEGAVAPGVFDATFAGGEALYRDHWHRRHQTA